MSHSKLYNKSYNGVVVPYHVICETIFPTIQRLTILNSNFACFLWI
jgi:hypothetical protein